jgi:hypothetical protein
MTLPRGKKCGAKVVLHATWCSTASPRRQRKQLMAGDIGGTRITYLGMIRKLLTDARETSYVMRSSLLTAECSTLELPGIRDDYLP